MKMFGKLTEMFHSAAKKTVLVIDDSPVDRAFVSRVLSSRYQVLTASGGQDGINMARTLQPDLVILDYMMPDIKGPDVCRVLKNDELTRSIPVVFLTSMDGSDWLCDGFEVGADNYLIKPIRSAELIAQVALRLQPPKFGTRETKECSI